MYREEQRKKMAFIILALVLLLRTSDCIEYEDNGMPVFTDEEYQRLPQMYQTDNYQRCLIDNRTFCLATWRLVPAQDHKLYEILKNMSHYGHIYYDHTRVYRGVCVDTNDSVIPHLQSHVNHSLYSQYRLEANLENVDYCKTSKDRLPVDWLDWVFVMIAASILMLNFAGTFREIIKSEDTATTWLTAFSVQQNWARLISTKDGDQNANSFQSFHGLRTMTMMIVIFGHVMLAPLFKVPPDNPRFLEQLPYQFGSAFVYGGYLLMQTFMLLSSFLLAYHLKHLLAGKALSWNHVLLGIGNRSLRLMPTYMLVVLFSATWSPRMSAGPLCSTIEQERSICRQKWWYQLLFVHNIVDAKRLCLGQSWYLGVDMQLFILGLIVLKFTWNRLKLARAVLYTSLVLVTLLQSFLVYWFELKPPQLMQTPETLRSMFKSEPSFWYLYTTAQGNVQGYLLGLLIGLEYYDIQQNGRTHLVNARWFRLFYWFTVPVGTIWLLLVTPFLQRPPGRLGMIVYAAFDRLVFAIVIAVLAMGNICGISHIYQRILEWRGWSAPGRLGFSALLLHGLVYLPLACSRQHPHTLGLYPIIYDTIGSVILSYLLAIPLTLLVEMPCQRLQKYLLSPGQQEKKPGGRVDINDNCVSNGKRKKVE